MQPGQNSRISSRDRIMFADHLIASRRAGIAFARGVEKNFAIHLWGGAGDQVCASPTLAWAFKNFRGCKITLATDLPDLFRHLPFERIYDSNVEQPIWEKYLKFTTISPPEDPGDGSNLPWYFFSHGTVNCVDFCTMHSFRWELPVADKEITLNGIEPTKDLGLPNQPWVFVHPGKHWSSKTQPKDWWDAILEELITRGIVPIIIGGDADKNKTTVNVNTQGCVDIRNKTTWAESAWLLQRAKVLLTNDSSPLHIAASGDAWIGALATCKHWDFISHWRHGEWQWREKNFSKGNMYYTNPPNLPTVGGVKFGDLDEKTMRSWLPEPKEMVDWTEDKWKS